MKQKSKGGVWSNCENPYTGWAKQGGKDDFLIKSNISIRLLRTLQGDPKLTAPSGRNNANTSGKNEHCVLKYIQFKNYLPNIEVPKLSIGSESNFKKSVSIWEV